MSDSILYTQAIWVNWFVFLLALALSVELGFRVGLWRRKNWLDSDVGGGSVVLTSTLALLGLILAFTYSASASRLDARKQAVIVEANAIGTAFLRAGLVAGPEGMELREALLDYARTRVILRAAPTELYTEEGLDQIVDRQLKAQAPLWPITEKIVNKGGRGPVEVALMASVNDVLDMHTIRLSAVLDRLPTVVLVMLVFIASAALTITGFNAGLSGVIVRGRLSVFALVLSSVMYVIVDFDRPRDGFIRVSEASMLALIDGMEQKLKQNAAPGQKP
ncbi:MAG: hypothetical protein V7709_19285 [Halioglobus sp.]